MSKPLVVQEIESLIRLYYDDVVEGPNVEFTPTLSNSGKVVVCVCRRLKIGGAEPSAEIIVDREGTCQVACPPEAHEDFGVALARVAIVHRKYFNQYAGAVRRQLAAKRKEEEAPAEVSS